MYINMFIGFDFLKSFCTNVSRDIEVNDNIC